MLSPHLIPEPLPVSRPAGPLKAVTPFRFFTSFILPEATGLRASTLAQLVKLLRQVPESCIYYHTHHFLLQHHYLAPEPASDVAYWVAEILGERRLGESLASIDTMAYANLGDLQHAITGTIDAYLREHPSARLRCVGDREEFFFVKCVHLIMPTPHTASTLLEFAQALERVSLPSLYFHMFDARLRIGRSTNDFSIWMAEQLNLNTLAERVSVLDPYAHTLETLRTTLLAMIREHLGLM